MRFQSSIIIENQSLPHSKRSIIKGTFHYDNSVELTYFPIQRVQQAHNHKQNILNANYQNP